MFQNFVMQLREHGVYYMLDFTVGENKQKFKPCLHDYRIFFQYKTVLQEQSGNPAIPKYGFSFTDFSKIERMSNNNDYLIGLPDINLNMLILFSILPLLTYFFFPDIVGCIVSCSPLREFNTNDTHYRNVIVDLDNLRYISSSHALICVLY